ncbi:MAG: glycosyltransferase [Akkermansia sp.]|nr:glycosyltransferase [Akkermansia sp.]
MNTPAVSVIVPVYNAEKYLCQTLDCICGQTLQNIEIILVDDGSTDSSLSILRTYEQKDSRIKIIEQKNQYAGVARNNGMHIAKGKYLSFLDSDDLFEPHMYATMVNIAEKEQSDIVMCNVDVFYDLTGKTESRSHFCNLSHLRKGASPLHFCPLTDAGDQAFNLSSPAPWNKLFRKTFVEKHNLSYAPFKSSNDLEFVLSAFAHAKVVSACTDVLIHYRISPNSISHTQKGRSAETSMRAYESLKKRLIADNLWNSYQNAFNLRYCNSEAWHIKTLSKNHTLNHILNWRDKWEPIFKLLSQSQQWLRYTPSSSDFYLLFDPMVIIILQNIKELERFQLGDLLHSNTAISFIIEGKEENAPDYLYQTRAWEQGRIHFIQPQTVASPTNLAQKFPHTIIIELPLTNAAIKRCRELRRHLQYKLWRERFSLLISFMHRTQLSKKFLRKYLRHRIKELSQCLKVL